jgi:hypothetical protein
MNEKTIPESTQSAQLEPNLSPQVQEALTMLNIRVNDLLTQFNTILNLLIKENAELKQQIEQQQKTPPEATEKKAQP